MNSIKVISRLALFVLIASVFPIQAQAISWSESTGPEGGDIRSIAIDPISPSTIYAGVFKGGMFKSQDGGSTWVAINQGLVTLNRLFTSIIIDPVSPSTLYVGTNAGAFKSTDGGANWVAINSGLTNMNIKSIVVDYSASSIVYAGTFGNGVQKGLNVVTPAASPPTGNAVVPPAGGNAVVSPAGGGCISNPTIGLGSVFILIILLSVIFLGKEADPRVDSSRKCTTS